MKKKITYELLKYSTKNLGDEIQSIAAERFLPRVDRMIDRDYVNEYSSKEGAKTKIILNGWFMRKGDKARDTGGNEAGEKSHNWPPRNPDIDPLLTSFHISDISSENVEKMTSKKALDFYRKHGPVGCRDTATLSLLKQKKVDAYFSGCLTLTLESAFSEKDRTDTIYIVDVDRYIHEIIPEQYKKKVKFITHFTERFNIPFSSYRFWKARRLLDKYARAKLVITSRLHCALPCLAYGTPVLFIHPNLSDIRFSGLLEYLHHYSVEDLRNERVNIDWQNPAANPKSIEEIRRALVDACEDYIRKSVNEENRHDRAR